MAFCPSCGSPLVAGATSCAKCGGPAGAASPFGSTPQYAPPAPAASPWGAAPGYLPETSNVSIILALVAWVFGGFLLSIPAWFMARSEMRGIREGRYSQASLGKTQAAYWIALANIVLQFLACGFILVMFLFMGGIAAFGVRSAMKQEEESKKIRAMYSMKAEADLISEIDGKMPGRGAEDAKLWKDVKSDWDQAREAKKKGKPMEWRFPSAHMDPLLLKCSGDEQLWTALSTCEEKVAEELGQPKPMRIRYRSGGTLPAEKSPEDGGD